MAHDRLVKRPEVSHREHVGQYMECQRRVTKLLRQPIGRVVYNLPVVECQLGQAFDGSPSQ